MRVTGPLLKVLRELLHAERGEAYGLEILRATGIRSGTLYPLLDRMLNEGHVEANWEAANPAGPRRRFYKLTPHGVDYAREQLADHGHPQASSEGTSRELAR